MALPWVVLDIGVAPSQGRALCREFSDKRGNVENKKARHIRAVLFLVLPVSLFDSIS
jgi:hypothetical protein